MKPSTRELLEAAIIWGKRNSGHGYSMSRLVELALQNEDADSNPEVVSAPPKQ